MFSKNIYGKTLDLNHFDHFSHKHNSTSFHATPGYGVTV